MKKIALIVDAYSSGNQLAGHFRDLGCRCFHLQSQVQIPAVFAPSFHAADFEKNYLYIDDFSALLIEMQRLSPYCVVAGSETGVILADRLADELNLRGNPVALSAARRNKYLMQQRLRERGVCAIAQEVVNSPEQALLFHRQCEWSKTIVKPIESAGTDAVLLCTATDEVRQAVQTIIGTQNKIGLHNTQALLQEYLVGTEYIVDTVSRDGCHYLTDVWKYHKQQVNNAAFIYDLEELLSPDEAVVKTLEKYAFEVLDALAIRNGPAHHEIIMTEQGPTLVEVGARLCGSGAPRIIGECTGTSPAWLTATIFAEMTDAEKLLQGRYKLAKYAGIVYLISHVEGKLRSLTGLQEIKNLRSFYDLHLNIEPGNQLVKTVDIFTQPGQIELAHENRAILMEDYKKIRQLEKNCFYRTDQSP